MKKFLRFIIALLATPVLIITAPLVMLIEYAFDHPSNHLKEDFKNWLDCITFKD